MMAKKLSDNDNILLKKVSGFPRILGFKNKLEWSYVTKDRDVNASINILNRATAGHVESNACGEGIKCCH